MCIIIPVVDTFICLCVVYKVCIYTYVCVWCVHVYMYVCVLCVHCAFVCGGGDVYVLVNRIKWHRKCLFNPPFLALKVRLFISLF